MTNPRFSLEDGDLSFVINHFSFVINFDGGRGIRTPGTVSRPTVFKTAALNHSAIPPLDRIAETFTRTLRPKTLRHASRGGSTTERFRNPTMKRAASATFLLFYTALTVVAISEHTAAYASTIAHSPLRAQTVRASSPHSSQARILQEPFAGFQVTSGFALGEYGATSV